MLLGFPGYPPGNLYCAPTVPRCQKFQPPSPKYPRDWGFLLCTSGTLTSSQQLSEIFVLWKPLDEAVRDDYLSSQS